MIKAWAFLLVLLASPALGGTAAEMTVQCDAAMRMVNEKDFRISDIQPGAFCLGYMSGYLDGATTQRFITATNREYCAPDKGVPIEKMIDLLRDYLIEHPNNGGDTVRTALAVSLAKAYPCPAK